MSQDKSSPIHVAIMRRVLPGREIEFREGLQQFFRDSMHHDGVLGAYMIVPPAGSDSRDFGIMRTFAGDAERQAFYASPMFMEWDARAAAMTEGPAQYKDLHGLEAWFRHQHRPPPRWKMAVVTCIGVYPTSLFLSALLGDVIHPWHIALRSLVMAVCMVALLTWLVMPVVTKVLKRWI